MHGLSYFLLFPALQKVHSEDPSCQAVTDILYVLFDGTTFLFQGTDFILVLIFKPEISVPVYAHYTLWHREATAVIKDSAAADHGIIFHYMTQFIIQFLDFRLHAPI